MNLADDKSSIVLKSSEEARCYYSTDGCEFNLENGTETDSGLNYIHTISSSEGIKYYIKCTDKWNNTNPYCALIVSKSDVI